MKRGAVIGDKVSFWAQMNATANPRKAARVLLSFLGHPYAQEMTGRYLRGMYTISARYEYTGEIDDRVLKELDGLSLRAAAGKAPKVEEPPMTAEGYVLTRDTHYSWAARLVADGVLWFSATKKADRVIFQYIPATAKAEKRRNLWKWL